MKLRTHIRRLVTLACMSAGVHSSLGVTLISDNFDTNLANGASVNGRSPDVNAFNNTWIGSPNILIGDGAGGLRSNIASTRVAGSALIDLGPNFFVNATPGVYQASISILQPVDTLNSSWIGLGFSTNGAAAEHFVVNNGAPWFLFRNNGAVVPFAGPMNTNGLPTSTATQGTAHDFVLQLDTTSAFWKVDLSVDGVAIDLNGGSAGTSYSYSLSNPNPNIRYLGLSAGYNNKDLALAIADNFLFTGPALVPEPSRALLMFVGFGLLIARRRR